LSYLLDTNVVSELRKARTGRCDAGVARWIAGVEPASLFISAVTLYELERGVLLTIRRNPEQGSALRRWLTEQVETAFGGRILPVGAEVARRCAMLSVPDPRPLPDSLIAATALVHGLTVVTRNVADFAPMGAPLLNPWSAA